MTSRARDKVLSTEGTGEAVVVSPASTDLVQTVGPATPAPGASWAPRWTPGPYRIEIPRSRAYFAIKAGQAVARLSISPDSHHAAEGLATARLLSAAPYMAAALHEIATYWDHLIPEARPDDAMVNIARAALLKATDGAGTND